MDHKKHAVLASDGDAVSGASTDTWNPQICLALVAQLEALRQQMLSREASAAALLAGISAHFVPSARNLLHYLVLRETDLRNIQTKLSWLGLSSLSHSESHVLANLNKVIGLLHRITGQAWQDRSDEEPLGSVRGQIQLEENTARLIGPRPKQRNVRIMVTLPSEAALDYALVHGLVACGMEVARINCAHDDASSWKRMAQHVRTAAHALRREVRILADLGGPKLRTGPIAPGPAVLKLRPGRDEYGTPFAPARLVLCSSALEMPELDELPRVTVGASWLARLRTGRHVEFMDARGAKRHMLIQEVGEGYAMAELVKTSYITAATELVLDSAVSKKTHKTKVGGIEPQAGSLHLGVGDVLRVTRDGMGQDAVWWEEDDAPSVDPAHVACTLPEVIDQVRVGERIWFDDGKIGGVVRASTPQWLEVEITQARAGGQKLGSDKGINLPDSQLSLPALTDKDKQDLGDVAKWVDMVGLSFVQRPQDVHELLSCMHACGAQGLGIVLKIETLRGFECLPELMLAAMSAPAAGVMIARGDLAVECGFERMGEIQEEILWCAESAHMPVFWATQVLDTLARTGMPSRAEISDAGLAVRAECVMLNKGPYITQAIRTLDDILVRMQAHQTKKRPLLRALRAWSKAAPAKP